MSGGVDSSVAALLLQQQGYDVHGVYMQNWQEYDDNSHCSTNQDLTDATAVCKSLNIPLNTVNFSEEYWNKVFQYFLDEYAAGRTPNPDILCNKEIKFKAFLDYAKTQGAEYIATGHYARCRKNNNQYELLKGLDQNKDQSYFLYTLQQEQLQHSLFPIGELTKPHVREIAKEAGFLNHGKKDSTGICFIGERKFKSFLSEYLLTKPGNIETTDGKIIGKHDGLMFYTLGQRQGIGIGGRKDADTIPWYVVAKDLKRNVLIVGQGHDHSALLSLTLTCNQLHWVSSNTPMLSLQCSAKVRYRQTEQTCQITTLNKDLLKVTFTEPQWAITPGQSVVFYQDEVCLGGGIIC